ncbi:MAG: translation initiation factor IF-2 [Candidatus Moranbacteria bacterium RIFOXYB1_FULL_43_19]|nr:MAG: translation initiation factor IF-2 [Candidatus Moranbacteria bacterium RIFOXYB1_FULL_43_19]OGI32737.1 MAG: translation initiation factor IF-2 [Candidatus Moranbacteria bacterium RIFOXYC1_FULL_44_13]OGI37953.1 MAG: translation initiation factor IF-2 [Candidatus Moranbacteria bacterium RIFOXYD1_FULL_44_12]
MEATEKVKIKIPSLVSVKKFAELLGLGVTDVIKELMKNKILATINDEIDYDTAAVIASDLGFETEVDLEATGSGAMTLEQLDEILKKEKESGKNLRHRPPVVTILGHVDHGKTTLLDTIRKTSVVEKEAGGITQHISAYQVKKKGEIITFVDTPGHEAFSAMRERGVSFADIAILVVAADDGVRPQTEEVIQYLKEKKIPMVVAINKIDKPNANAQKVKQELADREIVIEEWGGNVVAAEISAKQNIGIDELLDMILLVAEVEDLRADYRRLPLGVVIESHLDPQKGNIATVLVRTGILKEGQDVLAGTIAGRVRRLEDFKGRQMKEAGPSTPVTVIGLNQSPNVNDVLQGMVDLKSAKAMQKDFGANEGGMKKFDSQSMLKSIEDQNVSRLNIILKTDVQGSLEAIDQILGTIKSEEVGINYVKQGVGDITESDVKLGIASSSRGRSGQNSGAVVFGFNSQPTTVAKRLAEVNNVEIKTYKVIYELVEDIKRRLEAMLGEDIIRTDLGKLKVLAVFKTGKEDMIVGGKVTSGKMVNEENLEILRDDKSIGRGKLSNLQQNKVNVDEVKQGLECGITFLGDAKIKEGDILVCFHEEVVKKTL